MPQRDPLCKTRLLWTRSQNLINKHIKLCFKLYATDEQTESFSLWIFLSYNLTNIREFELHKPTLWIENWKASSATLERHECWCSEFSETAATVHGRKEGACYLIHWMNTNPFDREKSFLSDKFKFQTNRPTLRFFRKVTERKKEAGDYKILQPGFKISSSHKDEYIFFFKIRFSLVYKSHN